MTIGRVDREGTSLSYDRVGDAGDPVVLVHDEWTDRHLWDRTLERLGSALQLLAYDRRGHAQSHGPLRAHPVRDDAGDLATLLESVELFPAHVVALGYGGSVALRLAEDRPELVRSVVAHEIPAFEPRTAGLRSEALDDGPASALREVLEEFRARGPQAAAIAYLARLGAPEERWERLDDGWRERMLRDAEACRAEIADPDRGRTSADELAAVTVPVLLTAGGRTPPSVARAQAELAARLPNATTIRLGAGGHFAPWYDPDLFAGVVGEFLLERNVPTH